MAVEQLIILDGTTFFYSDHSGDVEAEQAEGFFYRDVRHLSRWLLTFDGKPLDPLTSRRVDYFSLRIAGAVPKAEDASPLSVIRDRFVTEGVHEDLVVQNLTGHEQRVRIELEFGADFADVLEAQSGGPGNAEGKRWVDVRTRTATLWHEREGYRRGTSIRFRRQCRLTSNKAVYDLRLAPHERWDTCIDLTPIVDGKRREPLLSCGAFGSHAPKMPMSLEYWLATAPELETDSEVLQHTYRRSLLDLASLRIRPEEETHPRWAMPGGGLPWYMTVFGRDSLIAAFEALPFQAELAHATLQALAGLQATDWDNFRDAEPGKIPHELRRGTLAAIGRIPHTPYYGTHDATPLFLILLDEYHRWTADDALVRRLEQNARAALGWIEGPADLDGDGYLEYRKRSDSEWALDNHCWSATTSSRTGSSGTRPSSRPGSTATSGAASAAISSSRSTPRSSRSTR